MSPVPFSRRCMHLDRLLFTPPCPAPSIPRMTCWTYQSNVADVLSLGPRIAGRLMQLGVRTVTQLLAAKPQAVAGRLRDERFTSEIVADWQRETRLLVEAPGLPADAARRLAAAGFSSAQRIARCTPTELLSELEKSCLAADASDWLQQQPRPSVKEVNAWIRCAQQAQKNLVA